MIKIENTITPSCEQWETIIRGMRNPYDSWAKSDSKIGSGLCEIGANDHDLMTRLAAGGSVHAKYRRMIVVYADVIAPLYWWLEFDTYKVGTVANSCSKMHRLLAKPFEMNDFSFERLPGYKNEVKQFTPELDYEKEVWKDITKTGYEVSDMGRVRHGDRVLTGSHHCDGYILATINGNQIPIHRLVANAFIPNPKNLPEVNHRDGNKMNNSVENLEWVNRSENQKHAVANSLQPRGLSTYRGKFTDEERMEIKSKWNSGNYSRRELAKIYNVSHTCINDIVTDKYRYATKVNTFETAARPVIDTLNELRDYWHRETDKDKKKRIWYAILQLLPESYNQKRTLMLNYEVLANIYHSRKDHKLTEWRDFCHWIESLPYSEMITGEN